MAATESNIDEYRWGATLRDIASHEFHFRLSRLQKLKLNKLCSAQVDVRFRRAMHGYLSKSLIAGSNGVFRVRKNQLGENFESASLLWYPPPECVTHRGRFNEPAEPVFYCSDQIYAAIEECRPQVGDKLTLLIAGAITPGAKINLAHIGVHRAIVADDIVGDMGGGLRANREWLEHLDRMKIRRRWLKLDDYLTEIATTLYPSADQDVRYKMTNAASRMLFEWPKMEGILYPSVAAELNAFNMCLLPHTADRYFYPFEAWEMEIIYASVAGESSGVRFTRKGKILDSGKIDWDAKREIMPEEVLNAVSRSVKRRRIISLE